MSFLQDFRCEESVTGRAKRLAQLCPAAGSPCPVRLTGGAFGGGSAGIVPALKSPEEVMPQSRRMNPRSGTTNTKKARVIALLSRKSGATLAQITKATGWQSHTVRAALTRLRKQGFAIEREQAAARVPSKPNTALPETRLALKPGARLLREWNGRAHTVEVLDQGFLWNGEAYLSLSAVARAITGARWSGPRLFGLKGGGPK